MCRKQSLPSKLAPFTSTKCNSSLLRGALSAPCTLAMIVTNTLITLPPYALSMAALSLRLPLRPPLRPPPPPPLSPLPFPLPLPLHFPLPLPLHFPLPLPSPLPPPPPPPNTCSTS